MELGGGLDMSVSTSSDAAITADRLQDSLLEHRWSLSDSLYATPEGGRGHGAWAMPYGVKSSQGHRGTQEDAYCIADKLTPLPEVQCEECSLSEPTVAVARASGESVSERVRVPFMPEELAFFGVYDGHGGSEVAQHCAEKMHKYFGCQLSIHHFAASSGPGMGAAAAPPASSSDAAGSSQEEPPSSFSHGTAEAADLAGSGPDRPPRTSISQLETAKSDNPSTLAALQNLTLSTTCLYHPQVVSDALVSTFHKTDEELAGTEAGDFVGATAVVAVVGKENIWIAHCGTYLVHSITSHYSEPDLCSMNNHDSISRAVLTLLLTLLQGTREL